MKSIVLRYSLAIILGLAYKIFYTIYTPLTLFTTFFLLDPFTQVVLAGNNFVFPQVTFALIPACIAATAYLLLALLVLLTRGIGLITGLKMFALGSFAIFTMNVVRILTLIFVYQQFGQNYFDTLHLVAWYGVTTLFVVMVWVALIKKYRIKTIPLFSDIKYIWNKN